MNKDVVLGVVRHLLTFGGGYVAAKGILDQAVVNEVIGAIMTLIGVAWSVSNNKKKA
jgi:hypothetical protein